MPNTQYHQRQKYLTAVFAKQQARSIAAGKGKLEELHCEVALRKRLGEDLDPWMEKNPCKGRHCLDHIDNNNDNNDPSNHQCLCRGHNGTKNGRKNKDTTPKFSRLNGGFRSLRTGKRASVTAWGRRREWQDAGAPGIVQYAEMAKNKVSEPLAVQFIDRAMSLHQELRYKDLVDSVALYADCSQQTAARYVDKQCAPLVLRSDKLVAGRYEIKYVNGEKIVRRRASVDDDASPSITPDMLG